ncbi:hypothetical protein [Streptomyces griseosporeus]|uniref:hypothetical protein n=1 Tax=Streptomyces griseosporeus TaxID=1910 RepID=UPI0036FEA343
MSPFPPTTTLEVAMDAAVTAWLLAQLGKTTDLSDITARYNRLGKARAVAIEVIRERLADLRAQPSTVNVSSVVSVSYAENIKAYERQLAALEAGTIPAPDDPVSPPTVEPAIGYVYLKARGRR